MRGDVVIKKIFFVFMLVLCIVLFIPSALIFVFDYGQGSKDLIKNEIKISVLGNGEVTEHNLEEYLFGVLAAEMPASFHKEALKAQSVAARTYIINKSLNRNADHQNADVCTDSTHCKAYLSEDEIKEKHGDKWILEYSDKIRECISETSGEIAVYSDEPIEAVFHSTGSGVTENAEDVWGSAVPYLVSVESPGDLYSPVFETEVSVDFKGFKDKVLANSGTEVYPYIGEISLNKSGSVKEIDLGGVKFSGVKVREMFSLPSANFTVTSSGENFVFHCKGKGHGVGMSQYGAEFFAKEGMEYKDILKKYYKGIEIKKIEELYDKSNKN